MHQLSTTSMMTTLLMLIIPIMYTIKQPTKTTSYNNMVKQAVQMSFTISLLPLLTLINYGTEATTINTTLMLLPNMNVNISFIMDTYALMFVPTSLFVTWSIMEFSTWYMATDPNINQFFKYLLIFLIAMLTLVTANNLFQFFIGWEGVGIMSFLLIGWWYSRADANASALQAIIYNRIGDIGLILAMAWFAMTTSNWQMQDLFFYNTSMIIPSLGLVLAAAGKSAQFGLHPWLPAAMEGPTPVSALLHSSTMVVAGIFMLVRLYPILENYPAILTTCLCLGAITTLFTAICALTQNDIKKIVAFSTSSQLGLMMVTIGLAQPQLAFIHISTHAFFKAMLFLCSGTIIHNLLDEQDIRKMGGVNKTLPITSACLTIGSLALMGTPFLAGFYSKDTIIESLNNSHLNAWALLMTLIATMLTAAYSLRITFFVQMNSTRSMPTMPTNENNKNLLNPILRLAMGSLIAGLLITAMILPTKTTPMTMPLMAKLAAMMVTLIGLMSAIDMSNKTMNLITPNRTKPMVFSNQLGFFNILHRNTPNYMMSASQKLATQSNDLTWMEEIGPKGLSTSQVPMINMATSQKSLIKTYLTTFIITTALMLIIAA